MNYTVEIMSGYIPVSVDEFKQWIYREPDFTDDDDRHYVSLLSAAAAIEAETNRKFAYQKIKWYPWRFGSQTHDAPAGARMHLPFGQNESLVITYTDDAGDSNTFDSSNYVFVPDTRYGASIELNYNCVWPDNVAFDPYSISCEFWCGWYCGEKWAPATAYAEGDLVIPSIQAWTGLAYECTTAGTSGLAEPIWPTSGTVNDGTVVWTVAGSTVPQDLRTAIKTLAADMAKFDGAVLQYPNYNVMRHAYSNLISQWVIPWP